VEDGRFEDEERNGKKHACFAVRLLGAEANMTVEFLLNRGACYSQYWTFLVYFLKVGATDINQSVNNSHCSG
jgi:hypothetical protein